MAALLSYCAAQPLHHLLRKSAGSFSLAADHLSRSVCAVHCWRLQHFERVTPHTPKTLSVQQVCKPEWKAPKQQSLFTSSASQMSRRSSRRAQGTGTALGYTDSDQDVTLDSPGMDHGSFVSAPCATDLRSSSKDVWIQTRNKDVFTAATEAGFNQLVFTEESRELAESWKGMANFEPLLLDSTGFFEHENGTREAELHTIKTPSELDLVLRDGPVYAVPGSTTVVEFVDWKVIPAENLVAAFDSMPGRLFAIADSVSDAIVSFEALERGTDGVVLRTENPADVFAIKEYVDRRAGGAAIPLVYGHVTRVEPVGMGDRACVDLCSLLKPGEGMLVGSFARALFLVHSECLESNYVASRPFRVNAGPVHSYVAAPGGKTAYLSELQSGREVMVVDSQGRTRHALVGRVKIESRPLILVEAEVDGQRHSILLQNAETVRLIGAAQSGEGGEGDRKPISVSKLKVGDKVLLSIQESAARHTGIKVKEMIDER